MNWQNISDLATVACSNTDAIKKAYMHGTNTEELFSDIIER